MGLLAATLAPISEQLSGRSTGAIIASLSASFVVLAIILNVLNQLLFKNPNEPPLVFHWVPFIGNTIAYGMDPYEFFFACRKKVRACKATSQDIDNNL